MKLEIPECLACSSNGHDFSVGSRVVGRGDLIDTGGDHLSSADDDGTERAAAAGGDVFCRKGDGLPHQLGIAFDCVPP